MSVQGIVFLVNSQTKHILLAGEVPAVYSNITGMKDLDYSVLRDLQVTFGDDYKHLGFLYERDALEKGITPEQIQTAKEAAWALKWDELEDMRSDLIEDQRWRINRNSEEVALGLTPSEDILPVLKYNQAIRDLPQRYPDPYVIVWPEIPPLP